MLFIYDGRKDGQERTKTETRKQEFTRQAESCNTLAVPLNQFMTDRD